MKFNHDADTVKEVFDGYEIDEEKVQKLYEEIHSNPTEVLGSKKSETMEYLHSIANDPEALLVVSMVLIKGVNAIRVMDQLQEHSIKMMKHMDLSDMPKDLAEKILAADDAPPELKDRIQKECKAVSSDTDEPQTAEATDAFEQLKRKYS